MPDPSTIPTSSDKRSHRPTKRRLLSPTADQAASVEALFAKPNQEIHTPSSATAAPRALPPPPDIVTNVQGSSAGAGSGEFHVYKAARRREYERLRRMDEEVRKEEADRRFATEKEERERRDAEKTRKNREKREKMKARKAKGKNGGGAPAQGTKKALGIAKRVDMIEPQSSEGSERKTEPDATEEAPSKSDTAFANVLVSSEPVGIIIHEDD